MPKINYFDGTKYIELEVSDKIVSAYAKMSQEEQREHWRKRKRAGICSLDEMLEYGKEAISDYDIENQYIKKEQIELLLKAINILPRSQRDLINKVFL